MYKGSNVYTHLDAESIKEEYKQQFEDVRKQVDTIKGVAAFNHI